MAEEQDGESGLLKILTSEVRALRGELRELRAEVDALKGFKPAQRPSPVVEKAPASAPPPLPIQARVPPPLPKDTSPLIQAARNSVADFSLEQFVGERLLHYVGLGILAIGILFFLIWRAAHTTPAERVFMAAATGVALIVLGVLAQRRPPYGKLTHGIVAAGWSVLYLAAFAAYHIPPTKIIENPSTELFALLLVGIGMVAHALSFRSRAFRLFSFGLTYFVLLVSGQEVRSFEMFLVLLTFSTLVAVELGHADILIVSAIGFYVNYVPFMARLLETPTATHDWQGFVVPFTWLSIGYCVIAWLPAIPRARKKLLGGPNEREFDATLTLNALAFSAMAGTMAALYFPHPDLQRSIYFSSFLIVPGFAYLYLLLRTFTAQSAAPVLGLMLLSAGIMGMPSPLWKMFAWFVVASFWVWVGLAFDQHAWRVSGLVMAALTFAFYFNLARISAEYRRSASVAMFAYAAIAYLFSRFYRVWLKGAIAEWELPAMELWLYAGTAALLLAFWGVLDAAPFAMTVMALAVAGEFAAVYFGRLHLWGQASAVAVGVGLYTFFIDYGANAPLVAFVTPRLLTSLGIVAGMGYLYYDDPTPREFTRDWTYWTHAKQRIALSWLMMAIAAFAVYNEFDPRARLPFWALSAALLYQLGRRREEENLKVQGAALALATAAEGVFSYLLFPKGLLSALDPLNVAIYWGSAIVLVVNVFAAKDTSRPRSSTDLQASWIFSFLALSMMAFFLGKELESYNLTIAWAAEGFGFLILGMFLDAAELRFPSLGLLALCVLKALLLDTSNLELPQRVATFLALGAILLACSVLYVRVGRSDEKSPPPAAS